MNLISYHETVQTASTKQNIGLPIFALRGTGQYVVDAVAGPYFLNTQTMTAILPSDNTTFQFSDYQLLPSASSDVEIRKNITTNDLKMAPESPQNNFLPALFKDIKQGTVSDTYQKDSDHKIKITLTHSTSHG